MTALHTPNSAADLTVAVVFHSGGGHTRVVADSVARGVASVDGVNATLVDVGGEFDWEVLDHAGAIVFGTPTYMGGPAAAFKAFMDASSLRWAEQRWADKLAAGFTNSAGLNGDKLNTLTSLSLFAMQHSMVWIGLGLTPGNITAQGSPEDLNRLAGFLGAMAQSNADVGPEVAPAGSDLRTAAHLGRRVAEAAARWPSGRLVSVGAGTA